jgi:hypothetical protein
MKKKTSALSIFLIALGALEFISQGYDIIGGGAPLKTWVMFVFWLLGGEKGEICKAFLAGAGVAIGVWLLSLLFNWPMNLKD